MAVSFFSRLERRCRETGSLLCVGLDPHPADLPERSAQAALEFCLRLVDATARHAAAFKPNAAFFEVYGDKGWTALKSLTEAIRETGIPVLLDAKRGDIASTAEAYAQAVFVTLGADAVTLNPYLGADSIEPFLQDTERGVLLLCKTSNPGAADLQDLSVGSGEPLYLRVARMAGSLNRRNNLGLVVGATQLEALARVRRAAPELWFLAPGVGAQGADLDSALQAGLRSDGLGMLIPVSRGIARAEDPGRAAAALRSEIEKRRWKIENRTLEKDPVGDAGREEQPVSGRMSGLRGELADALLALGCVRFGEFTLKSGLESPIYIDLRRLVADPEVLSRVAEAFLPVLDALTFDRLAALPYAALPIGTAVSLRGGWPLVYPRKEVKDYGTKAVVEGLFNEGERVVVLDDLITTGGSKFEGIDRLAETGLVAKDVVVLIDRSTGPAMAELESRGVSLHAVFSLAELLDHWGGSRLVDAGDLQAARKFLGL